MKGNAAIIIIVSILILSGIGFLLYSNFATDKNTAIPSASPEPQRLSDDPKYKEVKEKYNLSEEQLQILSTVNPNDND